MNYPDGYDTPAFPAGARIAVSRVMAIGASVAFLLIVFVAGMILWTSKSIKNDPFLISINQLTGDWASVGHSHGELRFSATRTLQESVVANFVQNWFAISADETENARLWKTCERTTDCTTDANLSYGDKTCAMFCATSEDVFNKFVYYVIPDYQARVMGGERWSVDMSSLQIIPQGKISDGGGAWQVIATVKSNLVGSFKVIAFAKVARQNANYPRTMGYYIADFNAYRTSK